MIVVFYWISKILLLAYLFLLGCTKVFDKFKNFHIVYLFFMEISFFGLFLSCYFA